MKTTMLAVMVAVLAGPAGAQVPQETLRRFAEAYLGSAPGSRTEVRVERSAATTAGPYMVANGIRTLANGRQQQLGMLVDPTLRQVTAGMVYPLPETAPPVTPATVQSFAERLLPGVLGQVLGGRSRIRWPAVPTRPTGVVAVSAMVSTGYGDIAVPVAVSADGRYVVLGNTWPLDRDPRAVRRELIQDAVLQRGAPAAGAAVMVAEFSDYQCPACSRGWESMRGIMAQLDGRVQHGLGNFPLVQNHPWSFRAAVAGICVEQLAPRAFLAFKEEMYRTQGSITLETVDEAVFAFLPQRGMDEAAFRACYMKDPAIDRVLRHMELGHRMGVQGTPSYYFGGELLPFGEWDQVRSRMAAILAAGGIAENAP